MPKDIPMSREPSVRRRTHLIRDSHADSGPWAGPNRNGARINDRPSKHRDQAGRCRVPGHIQWPTGSHMNYWPCQLRDMAGCRRGPGHSRYLTGSWMIRRTCQPRHMCTISGRRSRSCKTCIGHQSPIWWTRWLNCNWRLRHWSLYSQGPSTLTMKAPPVQSKPGAFAYTNVPKFSGVISWDQYRQVFDAIVRLNGWDDATVALQLLSHLEGDALNVTLLVPEPKRVTRAGLVGQLTEHYG